MFQPGLIAWEKAPPAVRILGGAQRWRPGLPVLDDHSLLIGKTALELHTERR